MAEATYIRRVYLGLTVPGESMTTIAGNVVADSHSTGASARSSHHDPKAMGREVHLLLVLYV